MDTVRINGVRSFEIRTAYAPKDSLLSVEFLNDIPHEFGELEFFTDRGEKYANFYDFYTVYSMDGNTVTLSNDGSVKPEEEDDPDPTPTLEERVYDLEIAVCEIAELNG